MKTPTIQWDAAAAGPLEGIRVIDLSRLAAGNMLSLQLADFGADVIKIEPPTGDPLRAWQEDGIDFFWKTYSRNKRSVQLNLRQEDDQSALWQLIEQADVFIENYRPGTLEKMGFSPEKLLAKNPNLIIVRISGFGQTGDYAHLPGFGTLIEGMSGFAYRTGEPDSLPQLPPLALADMIAGVYGSSSVVTALFARLRGKSAGQIIDLSLLEPLFSILGPEIGIFQKTGKIKTRQGNASNTSCPRNIYVCKDGKYIALSGSTQSMASRIFTVIGKPELNDDPRFTNNSARLQHRKLVDEIIGNWFLNHTQESALKIMREAGVTVGPIYNIEDIANDAHFKNREIFASVTDKDIGELFMHMPVPRLSATPGKLRQPAPKLGEHTEQILLEAGCSDELITRILTNQNQP